MRGSTERISRDERQHRSVTKVELPGPSRTSAQRFESPARRAGGGGEGARLVGQPLAAGRAQLPEPSAHAGHAWWWGTALQQTTESSASLHQVDC